MCRQTRALCPDICLYLYRKKRILISKKWKWLPLAVLFHRVTHFCHLLVKWPCSLITPFRSSGSSIPRAKMTPPTSLGFWKDPPYIHKGTQFIPGSRWKAHKNFNITFSAGGRRLWLNFFIMSSGDIDEPCGGKSVTSNSKPDCTDLALLAPRLTKWWCKGDPS